jgi:AcrR family transcriptional regulator
MPTRRRAPAAPPPPPYHHGDLRAALVAAAEAILREDGVEACSLRACARRAGVSHAAPAHHFGDARGLLSACAAAGFERLADAIEASVARAGPAADAVARLRAGSLAYIEFGLRHRALFQLMFRRDRLDPQNEALCQAGKRTGDTLRLAIDDLLTERGLPGAERERRILLAWSLMHGYTTLVVEDQCADMFGIDAARVPAATRMADELLRLAMTGLAAPAGPA